MSNQPFTIDISFSRGFFDFDGEEFTRKFIAKYEEMTNRIIKETKAQMPVDTGAAKRSVKGVKTGDYRTQMEALYYVEYLNEGHSSQAPANFIDAIIEHEFEMFEVDYE